MKYLLLALLAVSAAIGKPLQMELRDREESDGSFILRERSQEWAPDRTAVIVCDMWDAHHCRNAVRRVGELAPRIDAFLKQLRSEGAMIIHAPSSCTSFYKDHPARLRAQKSPAAGNLPEGIDRWLDWIDEREKAAGYPIDHSDGGEDDDPAEHAAWAKELESRGLNPRQPWKRQTELLEIDAKRDAITDSGVETWNLLQEHQIENVMLVGVHTNMCVLGRPFGLRQLSKNGVNVVLVRDLTDTMYNPAMPPKVSHYAGTDLIIEHIEKYVCPTVSSDQILGGVPFAFGEDSRPKILFLIGEKEYRTGETLPRFAAKHLTADYRVQILTAEDGSNDFGNIEKALADTDVLFVSVRRRALEKRHLDAIRAFSVGGKPILGIRTASHGFSLRGKASPAGHDVWEDFDGSVFGGSYHGHHGNQLETFAKVVSGDHPVVEGIPGDDFVTGGSLYKVLPLRDQCTILLEGRAEGIEEKQPVAWTFTRQDGGKSFYTSLGHIEDFKIPAFNRLLKNALRWTLEKGAPGEKKVGAKRPRAPATEGAAPVGPLAPEESLSRMRVPGDLAVDLVLSEPLIEQPLHLSFDARGRLWVVQYRQYPGPAGLKELSRDKVWRVAYDTTPPPPPHAEDSPFRGRDRISIHEDSNGDGVFDTHKIFADGLNMVTSVAHGDGGIWVTNPPYLLFYPDVDGDDVPDGKPEVHLKGFGLEDSHSIANSLVLGPDGWLYGAQGSTVSAAIVRPGIDMDGDAIRSMGQNIWRYHPERRQYEIFAEGGGNAFGVEIDSKGRVFSGHNGGDTRGFHYVQGAYYQKTWGKHGALTNPHAYGYFPAMKHAKVARFVHQFIVYEDEVLPERFRGKLWGVDVLHRNIVLSDLLPNGSTIRTEDIERVVKSDDPWFRPVMIAAGPDGSIYIADWYDEQVNHYRNHEGQIDVERGRVYRVRNKEIALRPLENLDSLDRSKLVERISSPSRVIRRAASDAHFRRFGALDGEARVPSLEALWLGERSRAPLNLLNHSDPGVRSEAVRLSRDVEGLQALAKAESHREVVAQLAASAKRIEASAGLAIAAEIAKRDELADDPHIPLLVWWAFECRAGTHPDAVMAPFADSTFWRHQIVRETLLSRLMRRFAAVGVEGGYLRCADLLRIAPDDDSKKRLIAGFVEAVKGKTIGNLPVPLLRQFTAAAGALPLALRVRVDGGRCLPEVLLRCADATASDQERIELIAALGSGGFGLEAAKALLGMLSEGESETVELATIAALNAYRGVGQGDVGMFTKLESPRPAVRDAAASYLAGDPVSARELVRRAKSGNVQIAKGNVALREKLLAHGDERLERMLSSLLGEVDQTSKESEIEIARVRQIIAGGGGIPKRGEAHFVARCSACHTLFGAGGSIGPDLTSYQRGDDEAMLLGVIAPGAEIREGYENTVVKMKSGQVYAGFGIADNKVDLVIRDLAGGVHRLAKTDIASLQYSAASLMPPGLLNGLDDDALRDLFAYLRATTPPY